MYLVNDVFITVFVILSTSFILNFSAENSECILSISQHSLYEVVVTNTQYNKE